MNVLPASTAPPPLRLLERPRRSPAMPAPLPAPRAWWLRWLPSRD